MKISFLPDNDTSDDAKKVFENIKKDLMITEDDERIARQFVDKDFDAYQIVGDGPYAGSIRIKDEDDNIVYDDS